jgi:hypothetical protein
MILKMDLRETGCEWEDWMKLAYEKVQWWAFVNMVTNIWVSQKQLISWPAE